MSRTPKSSRKGVSLIEIAAVAAIMGLVAMLAVGSVRLRSLGNYGAQVDTRDLAAQLHEARRRTVATGENHALVMRRSRGDVIGYQMFQRVNGRLIPAGEYRPISRDVEIFASTPDPTEFTFEGNAVRSQSFEIRGSERRWRIRVTQAGGGIVVQSL